MTECRDERVQARRRTRTPAATHAGPHLEACRTDSDGLAAVVHPSNDVDLHPSLGGCYDTRAAPGGGVCRETRGGACVGHTEEDKTDNVSAKVGAAGAEGNTCEEATSGTAGKCLTSYCDVTISGNSYCSQCSTAAEYLIDGACTTASDISNADTICASPSGGKCGSCGDGYFMYKGGCYDKASAPGNLICKTAGSTDGICQEC